MKFSIVCILTCLSLFGCISCGNMNTKSKPKTISELIVPDSIEYYCNPLRGYSVIKAEKKLGERIFSIAPIFEGDISNIVGLIFNIDVQKLPADSIGMIIPLINTYTELFNTIYGGNLSWNYQDVPLEYHGIIDVFKTHDSFTLGNYQTAQIIHPAVHRNLEMELNNIHLGYWKLNEITEHLTYFDPEIANDSVLSMNLKYYKMDCYKAGTDTLNIRVTKKNRY